MLRLYTCLDYIHYRLFGIPLETCFPRPHDRLGTVSHL